MARTYNLVVRPPASPTSVGRYSLTLDVEQRRYTLVVQVLMDTPTERDWRAEFNSVSGHYEQDGERLTFHVERGSSCVRSSAWAGRGVEDYVPFASFTGTLASTGTPADEVVTVDYNGTLTLSAGEHPVAEPALIVPDYALFS